MYVDQVDPTTAFEMLKAQPGAELVDVRTIAEWSFVGVPNLEAIGKECIFVEWATFPEMTQNHAFADSVLSRIDLEKVSHILFLCRSGVRSLHAANLMTSIFEGEGRTVSCLNIAEGFEGDLDADRHRGLKTGWKARALPWRQT